jgi:hypothetical protein
MIGIFVESRSAQPTASAVWNFSGRQSCRAISLGEVVEIQEVLAERFAATFEVIDINPVVGLQRCGFEPAQHCGQVAPDDRALRRCVREE